MMPSIDAQRRRIVSALVRRNIQGWGRPIEYTVQRLRLGIIFGGLAALLFIIQSTVLAHTPANFLTTVIGFSIIGSVLIFLSFLISQGLPYYRARSQPQETVKGKIDATICNPNEFTPVAHNDYHFITVRLADGRLRPFAVDTALHDDVCAKKGQNVTVRFIPGIERVVSVS